ncbi:MupG family TIM beta-alpha barrel fold protein [Peribacillus simplex]|uniref:MupG family TIM beta-alpha barrel fold protein n=1 Tax=Peribacillus simplex TaxID=1478 RepID=A0AAW7IUL3_9BACI|nr:MupG family TIM beta-alpha barrel fold protein [Peribacillus simplex]MDM5453867.1 MupG family TIM beta-alpha barrel fold protein [Peribacillus simplex]
MIGISFYLQDPLAEAQINHAANLGVKRAFTSLHIPEEKGDLVKRLIRLLKLSESYGMEIHADVTLNTLDHLGIGRFTDLRQLGIKGIRLDDGFDRETVTSLSKVFSLSLNASTLNEDELLAILGSGVEPESLIAWHNFYPRRETGLEEEFFHEQNRIFKKYGIPIFAFIPGAGGKRGPLHDGLPTLEKHRLMNPYAAGVELFQHVDGVYVGDQGTENNLLENLTVYKNLNILSIRMESQLFQGGQYKLRPDVSQDVFRLQNTRISANIVPSNTVTRSLGSITMDNDAYGRYRGEIQICRRDLEADHRVNVIGRVIVEDIPLLSLLKPGQSIELLSEGKVRSNDQ